MVCASAAAWIDIHGNATFASFAPRAVHLFQAETVAIASSGSGHLLAFRRGSAVWMTHVSADGRLLDEVQVSSGRARPTDIHVAWRGDDYVIEWQEDRLVKSARASTRHDDITVPRPADAVCLTLPPGGVVHGLAGSGGKTAIVWSTPGELHQGFADPESPSAGETLAREAIRAATVFATPAGFETVWLTQDDPVPPGDVTWASPNLIVYSKGSVIASRTMSRTRRHATL